MYMSVSCISLLDPTTAEYNLKTAYNEAGCVLGIFLRVMLLGIRREGIVDQRARVRSVLFNIGAISLRAW